MKVQHQNFLLRTTAGRVALLTGIAAGTVTQKEIEYNVLVDIEKRPYRKPVVAYGKRYPSVTAAAADSCYQGASLNTLKNEQAFIRNLCNKDDTVGFYWSE